MDVALTPITRRDLDLCVQFMHGLYENDDVPPDETAWAAALAGLLEADRLGRGWMIHLDGQPVGYVVVTFGYSLEFYGRDAFVDELFIASQVRGQGIGRAVMQQVEALLGSTGIQALHLEVEEGNQAAQRLYESQGFTYRRHMHIMSKRMA
ncbi:MAG: GNAT family N-acetyltransferase [Caldilineales bacterium]